jgi:hypothetical protein
MDEVGSWIEAVSPVAPWSHCRPKIGIFLDRRIDPSDNWGTCPGRLSSGLLVVIFGLFCLFA